MQRKTIEKFEEFKVIELYTVEKLSVNKIAEKIKSNKSTIVEYLLANKIEVKGASINAKFDLELASKLYNEGKKIKEISELLKVSESTISKYLKLNNIKVSTAIEFNQHIFDEIDTEEKAYWLGFIYADGNISSTGNRFEINLSIKDLDHMLKLKKFLEYQGDIRVETHKEFGTEICRMSMRNLHLWTTLNSYGCTPKKSLTLEFPNKEIFKNKSLIYHFIRGYVDGDGSLTYNDSNHFDPEVSILGTFNFLTELQNHLNIFPLKTLHSKNNNQITRTLLFFNQEAFKVSFMIYNNSTIYLQRKYNKYLEYCRLYKKLYELLSTNIGEDCDVNPEINSENKSSESSYSVEIEPEKSE